MLRLPPKSGMLLELQVAKNIAYSSPNSVTLISSKGRLGGERLDPGGQRKSALNVLCRAVPLKETRSEVERAAFPLEVTNVSTGDILTLCCDGRRDLANLKAV